MSKPWGMSERMAVFHIFALNGLQPLPESHDLTKGLAQLTDRSIASIRMKFMNFLHLATDGTQGLANWTKADQQIWEDWRKSQDRENVS